MSNIQLKVLVNMHSFLTQMHNVLAKETSELNECPEHLPWRLFAHSLYLHRIVAVTIITRGTGFSVKV